MSWALLLVLGIGGSSLWAFCYYSTYERKRKALFLRFFRNKSRFAAVLNSEGGRKWKTWTAKLRTRSRSGFLHPGSRRQERTCWSSLPKLMKRCGPAAFSPDCWRELPGSWLTRFMKASGKLLIACEASAACAADVRENSAPCLQRRNRQN